MYVNEPGANTWYDGGSWVWSWSWCSLTGEPGTGIIVINIFCNAFCIQFMWIEWGRPLPWTIVGWLVGVRLWLVDYYYYYYVAKENSENLLSLDHFTDQPALITFSLPLSPLSGGNVMWTESLETCPHRRQPHVDTSSQHPSRRPLRALQIISILRLAHLPTYPRLRCPTPRPCRHQCLWLIWCRLLERPRLRWVVRYRPRFPWPETICTHPPTNRQWVAFPVLRQPHDIQHQCISMSVALFTQVPWRRWRSEYTNRESTKSGINLSHLSQLRWSEDKDMDKNSSVYLFIYLFHPGTQRVAWPNCSMGPFRLYWTRWSSTTLSTEMGWCSDTSSTLCETRNCSFQSTTSGIWICCLRKPDSSRYSVSFNSLIIEFKFNSRISSSHGASLGGDKEGQDC